MSLADPFSDSIMLLAGTANLSPAFCSQPRGSAEGRTELAAPGGRVLPGTNAGAAAERTSRGWETEVACVNELICSLDSSYNLEKAMKVLETLVSKTCYQLVMFQSPAELRRFPCSR